MADMERRAFMKGATLGALAFTVGGSTVMLTAGQAKARNVPFRLLKESEAETIEALGETLVPGARSAGIAHFIDHQIAAPPEQALLQAPCRSQHRYRHAQCARPGRCPAASTGRCSAPAPAASPAARP